MVDPAQPTPPLSSTAPPPSLSSAVAVASPDRPRPLSGAPVDPVTAPIPVFPTLLNINLHYQDTEKLYTHIEYFLNGMDLVPVLSMLSGAARALFGLYQMVWYVAQATLNYIIYLYEVGLPSGNAKNLSDREFELAKHGFFNILKGVFHMTMPIVSNIYAWINECHLEQRYVYPTEVYMNYTLSLFDLQAHPSFARFNFYQRKQTQFLLQPPQNPAPPPPPIPHPPRVILGFGDSPGLRPSVEGAPKSTAGTPSSSSA